MDLNFKDKIVLITGASGGIGSSLVEEFKIRGAKVYGTDLSESDKENFFKGDIRDENFIKDVVRSIKNKEGHIDVLVNNAGIYLRTPVKDISKKEWENLMDINLTSVFLFSQAVIEMMLERKSGSIINLTSVAGKVGGLIAGSHYAVSKAAVECLTKSMAKLGAPQNVRVNAVAPGIIDTSMQDDVSKEEMDFLMKNIPMGRLGKASEVAKPILFLASDFASYMTGQNLNVNGGTYM